MRVYIAGPITKGPLEQNIRNAVMAGQLVMSYGLHPFIPHLYCFMEMITPVNNYERWMELDFSFLSTCQALLRLPGVSAGADREVEYANQIGIPVFHSIETLINWAKNDSQKTVRELASDVSGVVAAPE